MAHRCYGIEQRCLGEGATIAGDSTHGLQISIDQGSAKVPTLLAPSPGRSCRYGGAKFGNRCNALDLPSGRSAAALPGR
jgi:hypothetical protein